MEPCVLDDILDGKKEPMNLPFSLLENITRGFSKNREIGHGGFGTVYKGLLTNGIVAVKRIMSMHTIEEKPFQREVNNLLGVNHPNVVRFLGYCASTEQKVMQHEGSPNPIYAEIRERLLCFEYISNGSLHRYIADELRGLEWDTRYQIIRGVCEGLYYLHTEKHIIHMDLKPDNVLLDKHMIPKITDFGLSRPDAKSKTMSTDRYASLGYCAPEYLHHGTTSVKCDVYSLGVIIMELVTGRKVSDYNNVLRRWRHRWNKSLKETPLAYQQQVLNCIKIGLLCLNDDPSKRPSIEDIIRVMDTIKDTNEKTSSANESILGQVSSYANDDMLDIEPLNLSFRSELNNQMSCSLLLTNETDSYIAFNFESTSPLPFCTQPNKGIVPPESKCSVNITLQSKQKAPQHAGEFTVQSTKVNGCLAAEDITIDMFKKETGNIVDEVNLEVAFDSQLPSELLDVHPLVLLFPFIPKKITPCSLLLTNNTDEMVVFNLKSKEWRNLHLPRSGVVPPRSTYTLVVLTEEMEDLPEEREVDLILQHCISHEAYASECIMEDSCKQHIKEAKQLGDTVHKMRLKAVFASQEKTACEAFPPSVQITSPKVSLFPQCQDSHRTEPWIITGYAGGEISLWDYNMQKLMGVAVASSVVRCVQFVERKLWALAGSADGCIHVYNCKTMQNINSFRAHDSDGNLYFISLAVHPTRPYVLSSYNEQIKLWDWNNGWFGWKCIQTFEGAAGHVFKVAFNPKDTNSFASCSSDGTVQVWSLDSPKCKHTLLGHSGEVRSLDFFTRDNRQYLITGSYDSSAKIWDMQKMACVRTMDVIADGITSVMTHPSLPLLITGTMGGVVHFWSSTDFRCIRILHIGYGGIYSPICLVGLRRLAIGHGFAISVVDIQEEDSK